MFRRVVRGHEGPGDRPASNDSQELQLKQGEGPYDDAAKHQPPPTLGADGIPLSRRQQKKQVLRDVRMQRKGQKKVQKQANALEGALQTLHSALMDLSQDGSLATASGTNTDTNGLDTTRVLASSLCRTFNVGCRYRDLHLAHGPATLEGLNILEKVFIRPPKYNAKFLPQEYSLLHKIWSLLGGDCRNAGVLDIGAGNANCAVLAATMLGLTVVCVERESPREELRAEGQLPLPLRDKVIRMESDVADVDAEALKRMASMHGLQRIVLVAKHPCGIGVDRSIACAERLCASKEQSMESSATLVGVILATCCANKLSQDDLRVSRVEEFCEFYRDVLPTNSTSQTATLMAAFQRSVDVMSRCSAWRTASGSDGNAVSDTQLEWAELFEDALQALRLQRLEQLLGAAAQVRFAPSECTLQDRCLLAGAAPLPRSLWAGGNECTDEAFLRQLQVASEMLCKSSGPMDCRPRGLKSAKYDFDYTDVVLLDE